MSASAEGWWSMPGDETRPLNSVPDEPVRWATGPENLMTVGEGAQFRYVGPPRLTGWPLAVTIVGVTWAVFLLVMFILIIVFSDQIQALSSPVVWVE